MTTARCLVVADDLTGATDTGHEFAARGARTVVVLDADAPPTDADVVVVDTDSRTAPAADAADRVERAVDAVPAARVYKKVDSTLRGNPVAEVDAALAAAGATLAVVAPAFPATGRTTACGAHLVDGDLLTATAVGGGEDGPGTADLPALFAASSHRVGRVGVDRVARGTDAVRDRLAELADGSPAVAVCDATHERHLSRVAAATAGLEAAGDGPGPLWVGSAGLARAMDLGTGNERDETRDGGGTGSERDETRDGGGTGSERDETRDGGGTGSERDDRPGGARTAAGPLGVVGSVHPATRAGVAALDAGAVASLDPERAVAAPEAAGGAVADDCVARIDRGDPAVVASAATETDVAAAREAAAERGVPAADLGRRIERALAAAARGVVARTTPAGLFLTGGAVARATLRELGAAGVELRGAAVADGVPAGRVRGGDAGGLPVVTKAGGFGEPTTITRALSYLSDEHGHE